MKAVTVTVIAKMTSNYSEGLGNIGSVQKVFRKGQVYAMRSRESLKNAIMVQSGMYDDLQTSVDGATQKLVGEKVNACNNRALEGGYMNTRGKYTYVRKSSFYVTDAIACNPFVNETRFHNNLYLASNHAKLNNKNVQADPKECGLMPYQYEYDKSDKIYSVTIDLDMIGKDENFSTPEASAQEKAERVNSILTAVQNLSLVVRGNLDNAEPIFVVGGLSDRKTHYFENVVSVKGSNFHITEDLKNKIAEGFSCGLLQGDNFSNEESIINDLKPLSVSEFFDNLRTKVCEYYGVESR